MDIHPNCFVYDEICRNGCEMMNCITYTQILCVIASFLVIGLIVWYLKWKEDKGGK